MKRIILAAALLLMLAAAAQAQTLGASCPTNGVTAAPNSLGQTLICASGAWAFVPLYPGNDSASCSGTNAGEIKYSSGIVYLCNGSAWTQFEPVQSTPVETSPQAVGYFVLTKGTYNGNLGGMSGADSTCLTELTTNTGWTGYSTANGNSQLVAAKVHAFLCNLWTCTNLMPLATYYFANAGNSSAGGASFTTDSSGDGPNDSSDWAGANYFSGSYNYWTGRGVNSNTSWTSTASGWQGQCSGYTTSASGSIGEFGNSATITSTRWDGDATQYTSCNQTLYLICFVNP